METTDARKMSTITQEPSPESEPCSTETSSSTTSTGLILSINQPIRSFLISSSAVDSNLPESLRLLALSLSSQSSISYPSLRSIWVASDPSIRPPLSILLRGSSFIFNSPKPREKSEELKARLKKLEELAERKAYAELVKDITPKKGTEEPFSSYKDQLGFGLHVAVTMFTCYLVGYISFRALLGHNPVMGAAGGFVGLVCGMLVETFLFIIRTSEYNDRSSSSSSSLSTRTPTSNLKIKKNL